MKLLEAKNISHRYDYELFNNISLELNAGDSVAIIGVSGSGKSTFLHILSTLLEPKEGSVWLFGEEVSKMSHQKLSKLKRDSLGLVFQSHYLFKGFSAYENLEVAALLANQQIEKKLLEQLNITQNMEQKVTELSGGQQQRVSIARVLTKKPKIIFADEPTGNLDKKTAHEVMELLLAYCKDEGAALVLVTHDEKLAYMCKHVFNLENKELVRVQ
ncbi:MAG: ABC transporter ATP-binding protein [Sulfurimonadaceae bacterium]|jgi:putative ABC transport system ATP-binding protein|nr:ABC transporter ATP-binding protein [Sulfurimonadaceae bacterium]